VKDTINGKIISNRPLTLSSKYFLMSLSLDKAVKKITPGQFAHLEITPSQRTYSDVLLRRPFSIFNATQKFACYNNIDIVYQIKGKGTYLIASFPKGRTVNIICPLGQGFKINRTVQTSVLVGGGIGSAGLYFLLKRLLSLKRPIYFFIGAKTKNDLWMLPFLGKLPVNVIATTEDGSYGKNGLVADFVEEFISQRQNNNLQIYACGPSGMIEAIRKLVLLYNIPMQVSLEERMGCGIGLCRVCVCRTRPAQAGQDDWQYSTVCKDGPVFDAQNIC
jgi:dihydroorotate dehydrogenase electron transfer subunit